MGSGGGLGLAAVLAAAVLCGPGGLAGRVLSGECAGSAPGAGGRAARGRLRPASVPGPVWELSAQGSRNRGGEELAPKPLVK